jgi:long-chain acyl-CoA synthetase
VTLKKGFETREDELIDYCRKNLAPYKIPKIAFLNELPKSAAGKIVKTQLPRE